MDEEIEMIFTNKRKFILLGLYFLSVFFSSIGAEELFPPKGPYAPASPKAPTIYKPTVVAPTTPVTPKTATISVAQDGQQARWDPIHFKPAIDKATNEQCLVCHGDVLTDKVLDVSPAGVKASESLAWYQTLDTYEGEQQTFHQRHLTSKIAKQLMDLKCSTCHQGHDPSVEISYLVQSGQIKQPIRKLVKPEVCWLCHGGLDAETMAGLAGTWPEIRDIYNNDCMVCHTIFRTTRHQVNYLKANAIEEAGKNKDDSCYGCHGGRAWYQKGYPYPRNAWEGMPLIVPDWAKGRPTKSEARFLMGVDK